MASDDNTEVVGPLCEQQEDFKVIPLLDITVNSDGTDNDKADGNATSASCSDLGVTAEETNFGILDEKDECVNEIAAEPGNRPKSIQEDLSTPSNQIDRQAPSNTQTFNNPLFKTGERFDDQKHSPCEKSRHVIAILLLAVVLAVIIVTLGTLVVVLTHIASDLAECKWSLWSSWTDCNSSCGHGRRYRTRQHSPRNGYCSFNETIQSRACKGSSCEDWSTWTPCSNDCGFGSQFRVLRVMIKRRRIDRFQRKTCSNFTCSDTINYNLAFNRSSLNRALYISMDNSIISNVNTMDTSQSGGGILEIYDGAIGTKCVSHHEKIAFTVYYSFKIKDLADNNLVFEIGLSEPSVIDDNHYVGGNAKGGWSFHVANDLKKDDAYLYAQHGLTNLIIKRFSQNTKGTIQTGALDIFIDRENGYFSLIQDNSLLYTFFNVSSKHDLCPVFGVYNPTRVGVQLQLLNSRSF